MLLMRLALSLNTAACAASADGATVLATSAAAAAAAACAALAALLGRPLPLPGTLPAAAAAISARALLSTRLYSASCADVSSTCCTSRSLVTSWSAISDLSRLPGAEGGGGGRARGVRVEG
jgi:hypothetical protein